MGKSRKSTIRKFEFYETITDNGIESGYVRLAEKLSEDRIRASEKINLTGDDENV